MKISTFVFGLLLLFTCGCSAGRSDRSCCQNLAPSDMSVEKAREVCFSINFRNKILQKVPANDQFFLTYDENMVLPPSKPHTLPHPLLDAVVHFPPLPPNSSFVLYCPFTGCPQQPELVLEMRTDEEGNAMLAAMFDRFKEHNIHASGPTMILLYANPGYCSDWYLIIPDPARIIHTTFTYRPITVSDDHGRRMTINKKEPGGNVLEILLSGFPPKKRIFMTSCSAGETITKVIDTQEDGSYAMVMMPQVVGVTKGVEQITISFDDQSLQASCEWDMATMSIKRLQPPSSLWKGLHSLRSLH